MCLVVVEGDACVLQGMRAFLSQRLLLGFSVAAALGHHSICLPALPALVAPPARPPIAGLGKPPGYSAARLLQPEVGEEVKSGWGGMRGEAGALP